MREMQATNMTPGNSVLEVMTAEEAAVFLRVSRSTIYQRPDIPRHRLPGSRHIRFLRSELLAWLRGELAGESETAAVSNGTTPHLTLAAAQKPIYHRSARYR